MVLLLSTMSLEANEAVSAEHEGHSGATAELLHAPDFFAEILSDIPNVRQRLLITTMAYRPDHQTDQLLEAMIEKAKTDSDVRVVLQADSMSRLTTTRSLPMWLPKGKSAAKEHERLHRMDEVTGELVAAGGMFRLLNTHSRLKPILPLVDVNHIKVSILDNTTYLSGPNMTAKDLSGSADVVVKINDQGLADALEYHLFSRSVVEPCAPFPVEGVGMVIDDGHRQRSVIHHLTAGIIAAEKDEVLIAGKLLPSRMLRAALRTASNNGATVDYIRRHPSRQSKIQKLHDRIAAGHGTTQSYIRTQSPEGIEKAGGIHSFFIVTSNTVIVTTSIFSRSCEVVGMQDIAFFSQQPELVARGRSLFRHLFPKDEVLEDPQMAGDHEDGEPTSPGLI